MRRGAHAARTGADHEQIDIEVAHRSFLSFDLSSERMTALAHLGAHTLQHFLVELYRPILRSTHAAFDEIGLLGHQLLAGRRFVEGERLLQFLFGEPGRVYLDELRLQLLQPRRIFLAERRRPPRRDP